MQLKIQITTGGEVKWRGMPDTGPTFYGGPPPDSGEWKLDVKQLEAHFCKALTNKSYGESINTFILGLQIAELEGWGDYFTSKSRYMSHRPKLKALISVGQLNWPDVKDLSEAEQYQHFGATLLAAIGRIGEMQRKPRQFDHAALRDDVALLLAAYPIDSADHTAV
jgi:hypothetical protein